MRRLCSAQWSWCWDIDITVSHATMFRFMSADAPATTSASVPSSKVCPQCGINTKTGKRSCCARGGSWFKNCGDADDTQFDHTWAEGIQVCKSSENRVSMKAVMLRHMAVSIYPQSSDQGRNSTQEQTSIYRVGSVSTVGITDCEDFVGVSRATACFCVLSIVLYLQTELHLCTAQNQNPS